jgi:hypothetical protein
MDPLLYKIRLHAIRLIAIVIYFKIICIGITLALLPGSETIVIPIGTGILVNDLVWIRKFLKTLKNKYYQKR